MSQTFTSVSRHELQKAFGLAHKNAENDAIPGDVRRQFREIADLIWKAHGEPGHPPAGSGKSLLQRIESRHYEEPAALSNPGTAQPSDGPTKKEERP